MFARRKFPGDQESEVHGYRTSSILISLQLKE